MTKTIGDTDQKLFQMILLRTVAAFMPDAQFLETDVQVAIGDELWQAHGKRLIVPGFRQVYHEEVGEPLPIESLVSGDKIKVKEMQLTEGKTTPPKPYTEASLLLDMEKAGSRLDDADLQSLIKHSGIGTPATRASMIELLVKRGYVLRKGKTLRATDDGILLIEKTPPQLRSVELTAQWEQRLVALEEEKDSKPAFKKAIVSALLEMIQEVRLQTASPPTIECSCGKSLGKVRQEWICNSCKVHIPTTIAGRPLQHDEIRTLLLKGKTKSLSGFRGKNGKSFRAALQWDGEQVTLAFKDSLVAAKDTCPLCHGEVVSSKTGVRCLTKDALGIACPFFIPTSFLGKKLSATMVSQLLAGKSTRLSTFASGQRGRLRINENGKLQLVPETSPKGRS